MNRNAIIAVVIIVLLAAGVWLYTQNANKEIDNLGSDAGQKSQIKSGNQTGNKGNGGVSGDLDVNIGLNAAKEFSVVGTPFKFSVSEMRVKEGDMVRIAFRNDAGMHDWKIDEFNAATKVLQAGQSETIEFVANKKGTFEYYCSVGNHRQQGMKGTLVVE